LTQGYARKREADNMTGKTELVKLFNSIKELGLSEYCEFDFSVIRGFDYYTGTVFEVYDTSGENTRALFGGGRYDNLIDLFKDKANVSGMGFGFGDVTLKDFLETHKLIPEELNYNNSILITTFDNVPDSYYQKMSRDLRENGIGNIIYMGDNKKLKKQMLFAERKGISTILIVGEDELNTNIVKLKQLKTGHEYKFDKNEYISEIKKIVK